MISKLLFVKSARFVHSFLSLFWCRIFAVSNLRRRFNSSHVGVCNRYTQSVKLLDSNVALQIVVSKHICILSKPVFIFTFPLFSV